MKALRIRGICLLVTSFFALLPTSSAVTFYVGTCHNPSYSTISAAVAAVAPGATIKVCPGTYPEQVFIAKGLTLEGISSGNTGRVVVSVPLSSSGGPNWQFVPDPNGSATMVAPMIYVNNPGADVTIKDIATDSTADVNAPACGAPGSYWITSFLSQINQQGIHNRFSDLGPAGNSWNTSQPGCQVGIWSVLPPSTTNSGTQLTIINSAILSNYQGIYVECLPCLAGQTVNVNISGNTLNVSGAGIIYQGISGKIASNTVEINSAPVGTQPGPNQGIVDVGGLASDPNVTIAGNTLTKSPGPTGSPATGIDLSLAPVVPIISTNRISGFDTGIALPSGATSGTVKGNFISITSMAAINVNCGNPAAFTITGNIVNGTASAVSGAPIGYALSGITAYNADQLTQSCPGVNRKATTQ